MAASKRRVLIAGGGIGGLAASIALARRGIASTVLERSDFVEATGAGIQLGPNATRTLRGLGALEAIELSAFRPEAIWIFDGLSGQRLATVPLGQQAEQRYGAPYLTLHRADLHAGLLAVCKTLDLVELRPGFAVASVDSAQAGVVVTATDGVEVRGSSLIGADGLWSALRRVVAPHSVLRFAGATASRGVTARDGLPSPADAPIVGLWLGPGAHLVHYPVRGGTRVNIVAVTAGGNEQQGWDATTDAVSLHAGFSNWAKDSKSLLDRPRHWRSWSLYRLAGLRHWSAGRVALLGDAAHPVLPYMAQGAALAIEDAAALALHLASAPHDPASAFVQYAAARQNRAGRVQREAHLLGWLYHLRGTARLARNLVLGWRSEAGLLASLDWLYRDRHAKSA